MQTKMAWEKLESDVREISAKLMRNQICASLHKTIQLYFVQSLSSKMYPKATSWELNNTVTETDNSRGRVKSTDTGKAEKKHFQLRFGIRDSQQHWSLAVLQFSKQSSAMPTEIQDESKSGTCQEIQRYGIIMSCRFRIKLNQNQKPTEWFKN